MQATMRVLLALLAATFPHGAISAESETPAQLRGIEAVYVEAVVSSDTGLDPSSFTTAVEVRLRRAGVPVVREPAPSTPKLHFGLFAYKVSDPGVVGTFFTAHLALRESVTISRSGAAIEAPTWESPLWIGVRPVADLSLKEIAEDLADRFAADFLAAKASTR